ncbi:hypothetical protein [Yoonia sp.]|uniref:hypothetical protein n=1 Tax=Yoonia sp. TaxID=2212373 RepID=UPI001A08AB03|nr:hypothetical protein [Yoonia sp.]MBE0412047.1 hypothetical protein [Yoonia sp.]
MGHDWIIDVLADLTTFSKTNDLPLLAVQLEKAAFIASAELSLQTAHASPVVFGDDDDGPRSVFGGAG